MMRLLYFLAMALCYGGLSAQSFIQKFSSVSNITTAGGKVFFVADDGVHGLELWTSDGTTEGTRLVKDISPGYNSSNPSNLVSFNNELFFTATSLQYGNEVWKSDGTEAGTTVLIDVYPGDGNGSDPGALTVFNGHLYFDASPDGFNRSIYKSTGTTVGTTLLKDMGFGQITDIEVAGNYLYFVFGIGKLWRTDGTIPGTLEVTVDDYFFIKQLTRVENNLFFTTSYTEHVNVRLYVVSGTNAPSMLKEFSAPVSSTNELANFTAVGSKLFFSSRNDYSEDADELWWSDGTTPGTVLIKSFPWNAPDTNGSMRNFYSFNNLLYFQNGAAEDDAWWKSDGTDAGTVEVSPVRLGYPSSGDTFMPALSNGKLFLSGDGELWISDGTTTGTKEYYDINQSGYSIPNYLTDVNGVLYFAASDGYGTSVWNITPAAEIDVTEASSSILSGGSISFDNTIVNGCASKTIEIKNVGAKELVMADITVSGKDFYVAGIVPTIVKPKESFVIDVYFLPFSANERSGSLTIRNNDSNENPYTIYLSGRGIAGTSTTFCDEFENDYLQKTLAAGTGQTTITLTNNTILEKQSSGTSIGTLSAPGQGNVYSLVTGEGDADNNKFTIDGTTLKSQVTFDFHGKNIYTVRVNAQNAGGNVEGQLTIYVLEVPSNSLPPGDCLPVVNRINSELLDVEYSAAGHLFVCGDGGKLLKSTDGGTTWLTLNSGVNTQLTRLILKGTTALAAGDGVLLKSEDNGDTWSQLHLSSDAQIAAKTLFFLDADVGFVASLNGEFFKTTDGGVSWTSQGKSFPTAPTSAYFWNENDGIACTSFGTVHKTGDGGKNWTNVNTANIGGSHLFTHITFVNSDLGFMTSLTNLFTTTDGGESWSEVAGISGIYFQEVKFVSGTVGYVIGGYPSSELFLSTDAGINWDVMPSGPVTAARGIAHGGSDKVVIVGQSTTDFSSTEPGSVIMSAAPASPAWEIKHELHSEEFFAVSFPSSTIGYLAGSEDIYKTANGGSTWKKLNLQKPVYGVAFLSDLNGYMADGFNVYKTTNGGANWGTPVFTSGSGDLKQLTVLSASTILVYSESGVIYKDNGTSNWPAVFNQPLNQLQQIHFGTSSVGYGVDLLGKVIKTSNGGSNWSVVYTHPSVGESFTTIYFFDAMNGLMAGGNGVLYKTVNGGTNWTKVFSGIQAGIKRIVFETTQIGYAFTEEGSVYRSEDGGNTWKDHGVLSYVGLNEVSRSGTKIYYCGKFGSVGKLEPPKAPTLPGYISGDGLVCDGNAAAYAVASNNSFHYYWSVPGAKVTSNGSNAQVQFNGAGQYTLSVQHYTACGTSGTRTLSITVNDPPQPTIAGPEIVSFNSTVQFGIESPEATSVYNWDVTGATSFEESGSTVIDVTWGKDPGDVMVIETTAAGCRTKESKSVSIDPSTIVGVHDDNVIEAGVRVYPNPTTGDVVIESSLSAEIEVRVCNMMGQQYDLKLVNPFETKRVNFGGLPKGLYLVEISSRGGKAKAVKKIIKH